MEIYSACTFFVSISPFTIPISHPFSISGKPIRREESFFNPHTLVKFARFTSPSPQPSLGVGSSYFFLIFKFKCFYCWWFGRMGGGGGENCPDCQLSLQTKYQELVSNNSMLENILEITFATRRKENILTPLHRKFKWKSQTKTHKMEIEKHYTSNCEKIVKCGWRWQPSLPSHPTPIELRKASFYFVALLLRIIHFQGATLDEHKFWCNRLDCDFLLFGLKRARKSIPVL